MSTKIYGFIYFDGNVPHCFYVGRTDDMKRREYEHRRHVKNTKLKDSHLLKYVECRELEAKGIQWQMVELAEVGEGEYEVDSEKAMVIEMVLAGHKLTNLKHGDVTKASDISELQDMIAKGVRTTADVKKYREDKEKESEEKQRLKAEKLAKKIAAEEYIKQLEEELRAQMSEKERKRQEARLALEARLDKIAEESRLERLEKERKQKEKQLKYEAEVKAARKVQEEEWLKQQEYEKGVRELEEWRRSLHGF